MSIIVSLLVRRLHNIDGTKSDSSLILTMQYDSMSKWISVFQNNLIMLLTVTINYLL